MENELKMDELHLQKMSSKMLSLATSKKIGSFKSLGHIDEPRKKKKYKRREKPLTPQQIEVFRQAFEIFDTDHSGSIDRQELSSLLSALGFNYSEEQVQRIYDQVDDDGSGVIEINEFIKFMSMQMLDTQNLKAQILKVFRHFDDDNSGFLDSGKLKNMLEECFFNLDDQAINAMITAADTDGDGKINEYEFMRLMKKVKLI